MKCTMRRAQASETRKPISIQNGGSAPLSTTSRRNRPRAELRVTRAPRLRCIAWRHPDAQAGAVLANDGVGLAVDDDHHARLCHDVAVALPGGQRHDLEMARDPPDLVEPQVLEDRHAGQDILDLRHVYEFPLS